jgi:hypothetical protein
MLTKIGRELLALGFTLGASAITIFTLSGPLRNWAILFTALSLALHLASVILPEGASDEEGAA